MVQVVIAYEDGRRFQTTEAGFEANHEPFGAKVVGYVGADGKLRPDDPEGKRAAEEATDPNDTPIARQTAALQSAAIGGETPSPDDDPYAAMTVPELRALAKERSIEIPADARKDDLIAALNRPGAPGTAGDGD